LDPLGRGRRLAIRIASLARQELMLQEVRRVLAHRAAVLARLIAKTIGRSLFAQRNGHAHGRLPF
jgi:hypothetical protein